MSSPMWFYSSGDKQMGPVDDAALKRLATDGSLTKDALVCHAERTKNQWVSIHAIPRLRDIVNKSGTVDEAQIVDLESLPNLSGLIQTVSGSVYRFNAILLYNSGAVAVAQELQNAATRKIESLGPGAGIIGTIAPSIAANAVLGAIECAIGSSRVSDGKKQLSTYFNLCMGVRESGRYVPLGGIENVQVPSPSLWRSLEKDATGKVTCGWVFNDDPFIGICLLDGSTTTIFWSAVERYEVREELRNIRSS